MSLCSRDVPQKPVSVTLDEDVAIGRFIFGAGTTIYECRSCKFLIKPYYDNYCPSCGQKIDWSDVINNHD